MTTPAFLTLLLAAVAKAVPDDAAMSDADRAAGQSMARLLFEAFQPADPLAAAQAAQAVAACLAAMDGFARAARPGVPDEKAVRLRCNALAAGRVFDAALRLRRRSQPSAPTQPQPRAAAPRSSAAAPASQLRHRAELPMPVPGLADVPTQASPRSGWHGTTALTSAQPTIATPG
jgi:hypothetical protein